MNFGTAFYKEFLEIRRTKRFLIAVAVLVLFGIASPLLAKLTPELINLIPGGEGLSGIIPPPSINDAITQYIKNTTQFGVLLALLFGMGSMAGEKEKGTTAIILSKPMPRGSFIFAKFASIGLSFLISMILAGGFAYYYTAVLFGKLDLLGWIALNALILLYLLLYTALTILFSTLTKTQYIAIGLSFGMLILFGILGTFPGVGKFLPDAIISNAGLVAMGVSPENWAGLWVTVGLLLLSMISAWLVFRQQEL